MGDGASCIYASTLYTYAYPKANGDSGESTFVQLLLSKMRRVNASPVVRARGEHTAEVTRRAVQFPSVRVRKYANAKTPVQQLDRVNL